MVLTFDHSDILIYIYYQIKNMKNKTTINLEIKNKTIPASKFNNFKTKLKEIMDKEAEYWRF